MVVKIYPRYEMCGTCNRMYRVDGEGWMVVHPLAFGSSINCPGPQKNYGKGEYGTVQGREGEEERTETSFGKINFKSETP